MIKGLIDKIKEVLGRLWDKIKDKIASLKKEIFKVMITSIVTMVLYQKFIVKLVYSNDYLNPYTITFKNPKTVQMLNIIILYHYVMAFLVAIIIFTFIFIFLSFYRSYPFFYYKPRGYSLELDEKKHPSLWLTIEFWRLIDEYLIIKKAEYMKFYKKDVKQAIHDQITHAPVLEFLWVVFPAIILVFIAYPSVLMLYYNEMYVTPLYNITALGNQWYWTYEYNDFNLHGLVRRIFRIIDKSLFVIELKNGVDNILELTSGFNPDFLGHKILLEKDYLNTVKDMPEKYLVDSNMIIAKDPKFLRLLSTDQCLVIPSKTPIRILVTSNDVIHSWAVPSYGVKMDAVPGRINQQLLNIPLTGTSWGQCSELCGVNHAYMPIEVKVLSFGDFLFYMELKLKEIIFPFLLNYYKVRINLMLNFVNYLRENFDRPEVWEVVKHREELETTLNSKNITKFVNKKI